MSEMTDPTHGSNSNSSSSAAGQDDAATPEVIYEREQRLSSILATAVDAIITIDRQGTIIEANPATERMFGHRRQEMIGHNVSLLMPSPYREEHDAYISRYLQTREPQIIGIGREVTAQRKDGSTFPAHLAVSEEDHLQIFTGIVRDLTELNRAQEQLVQAERLAAIGQMMTGLAHESRNALQRTRACLDMLELDLDDRPEAIDLIRRGQSALDELHRLYEEVRGYAAPVKLDLSQCNLTHIWQTAWANLANLRRNRTVHFRERADCRNLECLADSHRIEQVLRNLLENAIVSVPEPGEIILECADAHIADRPAVQLTLRDNGPGFDHAVLPKVFEPFFTTKTKGTGLGMAIAKRIVEAHGGTIAVANARAGGAEIILALPREPIQIGH